MTHCCAQYVDITQFIGIVESIINRNYTLNHLKFAPNLVHCSWGPKRKECYMFSNNYICMYMTQADEFCTLNSKEKRTQSYRALQRQVHGELVVVRSIIQRCISISTLVTFKHFSLRTLVRKTFYSVTQNLCTYH